MIVPASAFHKWTETTFWIHLKVSLSKGTFRMLPIFKVKDRSVNPSGLKDLKKS